MQAKPDYLCQLIDEASKAAGSDYKLAQQIGTSRQAVSDWRKGRKTCPVGDQALMAAIAGLDAPAWTARAVVAQYEGSEKGEAIKQALKKALLATGAALVTVGNASAQTVAHLIRCINSQYQNGRNDRFISWGTWYA